MPADGRISILTGLVVALFITSAAQGQFPLAGPTYEFSFSNPGARSMGFGGAFVALADDATAAFANPAGLVQLTRAEVSVEGRTWGYSTPFTSGGRLVGEPTGIGLDTTTGLRRDRHETEITSLSFLSVVFPKERWSLALYRHDLADFESSAATQGLFGPSSSCCSERYPDALITTEFNIIGYGLSFAYRATETLSLGGTLTWFDGDWALIGENYFPDNDAPQQEFLVNSYLPERMFIRSEVTMDDTDWSGSFGLLWRFARQWSLGAVFRDAPNFNFLAESFAGPAAAENDPSLEPGDLINRTASTVDFPDVFGLGVSYRSTDGRVTVSVEADHVAYSDLLTSTNPQLGTAGLRLDDGTELHAGAEYVFLETQPLIGVRVGLWLDPDHITSYHGPDVYRRSLLPDEDTQLHYATGVGIAFERFQIDLAADFADRVDAVSISAIYSF